MLNYRQHIFWARNESLDFFISNWDCSAIRCWNTTICKDEELFNKDKDTTDLFTSANCADSISFDENRQCFKINDKRF